MAETAEPLGLAAFRPAFREGAEEPAWLRDFRRAGAARFAAYVAVQAFALVLFRRAFEVTGEADMDLLTTTEDLDA
mgnify:CR=1 FL=1